MRPSSSTASPDISRWLALGLAIAAFALAPACGSSGDRSDEIRIGVLLSYSGVLAANSINSERALWMAIEQANEAGGVNDRPVRVLPRDGRSDPRRVRAPARELLEAGVALFIGPDTTELGVELKGLLADHTLIMPSFTTADSNIYKPHSWFVMGAPAGRVACELLAQVRMDGRRNPIIIADPNGYSTLLAYELTRASGAIRISLPQGQLDDERILQQITSTPADAYVLAALPPVASSLFFALAAVGALSDPTRWYLSPTLHTPALLATIPRGLLEGARGVATGTVAGAEGFRPAFHARWDDWPLDDAYAFFDAAAVAVLALQRALTHEGAVPTGTGLGRHIVAVTNPAGAPVEWNQLGRGLELLRQGQEVAYAGLTGRLEFDLTGQSRIAHTSWWTIHGESFAPVPSQNTCGIEVR